MAYGECDGCPPEQSPDTDRDGERDCYDWDDDNDGIPDWSDRCPLVAVA
ncbi:MAG: thrombospondin type 3 repeat-containing protein [bacterium]